MTRHIILIALLCVGCTDTGRADYVCDPTCPPQEDIDRALDIMAERWVNHVKEHPRDIMNSYQIVWQTEPIELTFGDGRTVYPYGVTLHSQDRVWIWYDFPCEGYVQGLCPGVFDWEMGLVLAEHVFEERGNYQSTEEDKLAFREEHGLVNELAGAW